VPILGGERRDRNEAFVILWIIDLDCRRVGHNKTKRSTQCRVAAMAQEHGPLPILEMSGAAPKVTGLSAARWSDLYSLKIAVHRSTR